MGKKLLGKLEATPKRKKIITPLYNLKNMSAPSVKTGQCAPAKLSEEEINDPYLVVSRLFSYADLPVIREQLWDWLKTTVSGNFSTHMLGKTQRYDIVQLYEHIEKLVEAAHLLHRRHSPSKDQKKK